MTNPDTVERLSPERREEILVGALREIIEREDKAWMPVRAFRSEEQAELDDVRFEVWQECADIARTALATLKGEG